ncbi:MAG: c-type cytochrome [Mariprofundus sp.]|nr:c-type cytochrome [Mariprofundus sp.]
MILRSLYFTALLFFSTISSGLAVEVGDAVRGKIVAKVRCMVCHHLEAPSRSIGPSLLGIYGQAPSITGVPFMTWNDAALDIWLANPRAVKPNTRMALPPIAPRDRADIIAYFKSVSEL